jgi:hypothetical protein
VETAPSNKFPGVGLCSGHPTDWWFPSVNNRSSGEERKKSRDGMVNAVRICNQCPLREECLNYSLHWEPFGIWGGMPERERARMRRQMGITLLRPSTTDVAGYTSRV